MARLVCLLTVLSLSACTDDRKRDTPGGGFRAACMATNDCGCEYRRGGDDVYCDGDGSIQLQCLGSAKICTLSCQLDSDCTGVFGINSRCDTFASLCNTN